jgi:hypothetical protein
VAECGDWIDRTERKRLSTIEFEPTDLWAIRSRQKQSMFYSQASTFPFNAVLIVLAAIWCARYWGIGLRKRNRKAVRRGIVGENDVG